MVLPPILARLLNGPDLIGLLHHTDGGSVSPSIAANLTNLRFAVVSASSTRVYPIGNAPDGAGQAMGVLLRSLHEVIDETEGRLGADARKAGQLL
jgi:hypothetical protein